MNRRRKKLIRRDLQFKVALITLFVASFVLLINFQLVIATLWKFSAGTVAPPDAETLLDDLRSAVIRNFVVSLAVAVPLSITVAILYSFRFSGPIYRFKRYFGELARGGRWDERCTLRKGDLLGDVCDSINDAMDGVRLRLKSSHELIADLREYIDRHGIPGDGPARERLEQLRARVDEEHEIYRERMAPPATEPAEREELVSAGT